MSLNDCEPPREITETECNFPVSISAIVLL